jgi:Uma2 family endonuclease
MSAATRGTATVADLLAIPEERRFHEVVGGELVEKAAPSFEHGDAQSAVVAELKRTFQRPPGSGGTGWWIVTEVEVELAPDEVPRPDVAGWRRDRMPARPAEFPVRVRPDWVCEVVSPARASQDTVKKVRACQKAGIPHYWLLDLRDGTLSVLRWSPEGYVVVLKAERHERVRAEPFEALELLVASLFGDGP